MGFSRARPAVLGGVLAAALVAGAAGAGDSARNPSADPDPGFLEFLGSVDGLAELTPDYLAKADAKRVARVSVKGRSPPAPPPTPPPPPQGASGSKNSE